MIIKGIVKVGAQAAVSLAVSFFAGAIISKIVNTVANSIIEDAATEWFGEDLGNALISGASKYLGGNGTSGGQSPGDTAKVIAYLGEQQTVIAEEAEYQRSIRSPFDITSPYTFLGSLAYSLIPMAYSSTGIMGIISNTTSVLSSSLTALLPTADAVDVNSELLSTGDCPLLESTGAVGDAYCNAIIVTDTATLGSNPIAVSDEVHAISDNFEDGEIRDNSDLAKYITYCGQRTSQYGVRDASIGSRLINQTTETIIGLVPVIGDITSGIEQLYENSNAVWVTGEACVASDDNVYWNGNSGNNQLYQRYAENARLVESMNPGYTSDVTAYLEKYYEENPVDDSFEGTLARFAGMTKEDVEDTLALIDYYQFLADYDPSERYAFVESPEAENITFESSDDESATIYAILPHHVIYYDIRNRQTIG